MMLAATMLTAASCTDFSDYNDVPVDAVSEANQTIWQNILQEPSLTNFATLVRQAGFDTELDNTRAYTVWAPVDGSFDMAQFQGLSQADLLNQFVKNHVAEFGHVASGEVDERVHTLNSKSFWFKGDGSYTFDGLRITRPNIPGTNGVMHLLGGAAPFYPNLYEFMMTGEGFDSLQHHFKHYEVTTLDLQNSVKGPMVDGIQTYIDSVVITNNMLTRQLSISMEKEDSSYTVLFPTDAAFDELYGRISKLYNYIETTKVQDVENFQNANGTGVNPKTKTVNILTLKDHIVRATITRNLAYSNNDAYNQWITDPTAVYTDTLRSTTRTKLSNPKAILDDHMVGSPIELSNGYARIVDSLAFLSWETYNPQINVNPINYIANAFSAKLHRYALADSLIETVFGPEPGFDSYSYLRVEPNGERTIPTFFVSLPNVKSTTYNIYCVFLPSVLFGEERPNALNFQLNYCLANGNLATYNFSKTNAETFLSTGKMPNQPTTQNMNTAFLNDPQKTDTVFIGQFTFPVAYHGLSATIDDNDMVNPNNYNGSVEYAPNIKVTSPINGFNNTQLATYTRDVRIAAIILKPVELDEFEKQQ